MLTVTTVPSGAVVVIDDHQTAGPTPPDGRGRRGGPHSLTVRHDGYAPETRPFEARYGRAVIVSLDLERVTK